MSSHTGSARAITLPAPRTNLVAGDGARADGSGNRWALDWVIGRPTRVVVLVVAVALMGLGDLCMTMMHLSTIGMNEANPIARYVMQYNLPWVLVAWKCACIALSSLIFFRFRTRVSVELGVWFCCLVMAWLSVRWIRYSDEMMSATPALHALAHAEGMNWVRIEAER